MKNLLLILFSVFFISTITVAQTKTTDTSKSKAPVVRRNVTAIAVISGVNSQGITGTIRFTRLSKGVKITGEIYGLTPGKHGFHIHEKGLCEGPDFSTAGGHFNPDGKKTRQHTLRGKT